MNNLLKTKTDLFYYLTDTKFELLYKAQEAEDLHNSESAQILRELATHINKIKAQLLQE